MIIVVVVLVGMGVTAGAVGRPDWAAMCLLGAFCFALVRLLSAFTGKSCTDESYIEFIER